MGYTHSFIIFYLTSCQNGEYYKKGRIMNIVKVKDYLRKNYPLIHDSIKDMDEKELNAFYGGIFASVTSIKSNITSVQIIEEELHLESLETIDKDDSVFDKEFTVLEKLIEKDNEEKDEEFITGTLANYNEDKLYKLGVIFIFIFLFALASRFTFYTLSTGVVVDIVSFIAYISTAIYVIKK